MRDEPHRPTHRNHQHVPEPQIRHRPDDARQRPQNPKDFHGLHQTLLRGDSRRNSRNVEEGQRAVVNVNLRLINQISVVLGNVDSSNENHNLVVIV